ncbi:Crp/Fnr family transcriptional regulator [Flavobacterium sp. xlx-214]|uniref:Crp/Fnr family transcriptional regulator n=1 Tax=unclassified Flavobacterium TaxID=196869 RepID=UPI0013D28948|nr:MULTISPECIES: Crp/Fnr family transcriptional regulator [unclassified Flavobacterium]MBA5791701.1 Crp/Fnr family transcriptional regulator [Flavobacterium sp. xlx-221]QMI82942.1 Crp/Fnr family transcriptional regulator [Flavobacterium sp. xlx-214]
MEIDYILDQIYTLPRSSANMLKKYVSIRNYPKGHLLIKAGSVERKLYFIKSGIVRAFSESEMGETTFWFGEEGETAISMNGYVQNKKGYENIQLLEDCVFYELDIKDLNYLYENDIHIANWGRKFAEKEILKMEYRIISRELLEAGDRYKDLLNNYPNLVRRVPLKYIASYLGITQVSLSRIRKTIILKN